MHTKVLAVVAAAFMFCAPTANAIPAAWLIQGEIDLVEGDVPPAIAVGNLFSFVLHFDTDTPVTNPVGCGLGGAGTLCRHNGDPTLRFSDIIIDGIYYGNFDANPAGNTSINVRNNAPFPVNPVDGCSFSAAELYDFGARISNFLVIFRGPEDLNVVTDGRILPASPPPGLLTLGEHVFQYSDGDVGQEECVLRCEFIEGTITSVSAVPEPGSLALLGLGLAGLGLGRRRASR